MAPALPPRVWSRLARATSSWYSAARTENSADCSDRASDCAWRSAASSSRGAITRSSTSPFARFSSDCANARSDLMRSTSARAPPSAASAAFTRAASSARVRTSSSAGSVGWNSASTVLPATTGSPGSSSMRRMRPGSGAETTYRSRTRVRASSSYRHLQRAARHRREIGRHGRRPERPEQERAEHDDNHHGAYGSLRHNVGRLKPDTTEVRWSGEAGRHRVVTPASSTPPRDPGDPAGGGPRGLTASPRPARRWPRTRRSAR